MGSALLPVINVTRVRTHLLTHLCLHIPEVQLRLAFNPGIVYGDR